MILGITGISGSGKHTAAEFLKQKGWVILDADRVAHYLYRPYTALWKAMTTEFGEGILGVNDKIDRQKLASIVFNPDNTDALERLNKITHPEIKRYLKNEIHHLHRRDPNIAIVAALWEGVGLTEICDKTLLIRTDKQLAYERIKKRDGIENNIYDLRIKSYVEIPNPDYTIENKGEYKEFYREIKEILKI
ncbi:dephospho-CoA kinase [Candidatus Peregrinibacteria bacterium]|nr:dephospho-CoA kinase [Candidatus Peregrinibacteria bacterium]